MIHICKNCNIEFDSKDKNRKFCSRNCYMSYKKRHKEEYVFNEIERQNKRKETNLKKYGVEHHSQLENSYQKKCGNFTNPEILFKIAQTNLERYGVENPFNSKEIQNRIKNKTDHSNAWTTSREINKTKYKESRERKDKLSNHKGSKKEELLFDKLNYYNVERQKTFNNLTFKGKNATLRFDFYIPSKNICIEYDGQQHYFPIKFNNISDSQKYSNFIKTQIIDWLKDKYCIDNKINLVRIKYNTMTNPTYEEVYRNSYIVCGFSNCNDDSMPKENIRVGERIKLLDINTYDVVNYKKPSLNLAIGTSCTFKCVGASPEICINYQWKDKTYSEIEINKILSEHKDKDVTSVIIQGLEPLDNLKDVIWFIYKFRKISDEDVCIWTGYTEEEAEPLIYFINEKMGWKNIIIKFGRYIPNQEKHYDEVLGVFLASDNQYGKVIN